MERIKHDRQFQEVFISPSEPTLTVALAAEYSTEFYCMLAKGQPHIHFPALAVAWIKLTSVCLVLSIKQHGAHRQEIGGEREGGNVVGGI